MKTVIIGSGNVAYHMSKAFTEAGISITQVFGRNKNDLKNISEKLKIPTDSEILEEADLYVITVKDDAIKEVSKLIKNKNCLVVHTSGSLPKEVLDGNFRKASFYPLQTFSKEKDLNYKEIPFFIDAEHEKDAEMLHLMASKISKNVMYVDYEKRKYIHLTAVFASNFVNHLYARAKEISDSQGIPFHYFIPLILETAEKITILDPKLAQTGPAVRNDERVLELHKKLIHNKEQLKIYDTLNQSIKAMYGLD